MLSVIQNFLWPMKSKFRPGLKNSMSGPYLPESFRAAAARAANLRTLRRR
jgi:hypothetical protein